MLCVVKLPQLQLALVSKLLSLSLYLSTSLFSRGHAVSGSETASLFDFSSVGRGKCGRGRYSSRAILLQADQICYAVLCVFSFNAAGKAEKKP